MALTINPFDEPEIWPGFYIQAQVGETSVTRTDPALIPEQALYQYRYPGQPIVLLSRSNQVPSGTTVLSRTETHALGNDLMQIQEYFDPAYKSTGRAELQMYAEFKLGQTAGAVPGGATVIILEGVWPVREGW